MQTQTDTETTIHATPLDGKVAAVNRANAEAKRLHPLFVEAFRPFLGKKIITQSGLVAKAKGIPDALVPFKPDGYRTPSVYRNSSNYSLSFTVKVCESANSWRGTGHQSAHYAEQTIYVGELQGDILSKLIEQPSQPRSDWTADEIRDLRQQADDAQTRFRDLGNRLSSFGRYDQ